MIAERSADVGQGQVPHPFCHWYRADYDIGDRIRFVENGQNLLQGGSVHDLGISERSDKEIVCSMLGNGTKATLLGFEPVGSYDGGLGEQGTVYRDDVWRDVQAPSVAQDS